MLNKKPKRVMGCFVVRARTMLKRLCAVPQYVPVPSGSIVMRVSPVTGVSYHTAP